MSKLDKLFAGILAKDKNLRFEDLAKALERFGYTMKQPSGGSSHYTFRKAGCMPITIPKQSPMNKAYIELVYNIVKESLETEE